MDDKPMSREEIEKMIEILKGIPEIASVQVIFVEDINRFFERIEKAEAENVH